jgi:hypothetical protein
MVRLASGPSSESLQRTNPRWKDRVQVPQALRYVGPLQLRGDGTNNAILGEFTFCTINDFNDLRTAKIVHKQLWRDEPS